jgi:hypothetical protein
VISRPPVGRVRVFLTCVSARVPYTVIAWFDVRENIAGAIRANIRRRS